MLRRVQGRVFSIIGNFEIIFRSVFVFDQFAFFLLAVSPQAMGLTGQKLLSVPIIVQPSQAEKNRAAATANNMQKGNTGPMRLYVGSLHFNITEDMLKGIFEPFGKVTVYHAFNIAIVSVWVVSIYPGLQKTGISFPCAKFSSGDMPL